MHVLGETITVTGAVLNFRAALVAVLPMVEVVGIPWKRPDAYDDWDDLASCLYEQLVASLITEINVSEGSAPARLNPYDLLLDDYRDYATIDVQNKSIRSGRWIFHAFGTDRTPFDIVEIRQIAANGIPSDKVLRSCPLEGSKFRLTLPDGSSTDLLSLT